MTNFRRSLDILKYGEPTALVPQRLYYENHVLEFDPQRRTPKWVAEHITRQHVEPVTEVRTTFRKAEMLSFVNSKSSSELVLVLTNYLQYISLTSASMNTTGDVEMKLTSRYWSFSSAQ